MRVLAAFAVATHFRHYFGSRFVVSGKQGKRDQWEQMASRAKGIISYSMDFGGYVDILVYRYFGGYVDILDPWIIEDMSICRYIGVSISVYRYVDLSISVHRYVDMSIYRFIDMSIYVYLLFYIGLSVYRYVDISVCLYRFIDMSIYRFIYIGLSICRYVDIYL